MRGRSRSPDTKCLLGSIRSVRASTTITNSRSRINSTVKELIHIKEAAEVARAASKLRLSKAAGHNCDSKFCMDVLATQRQNFFEGGLVALLSC
jgi:hypothetical protein